MEKGRAMHPRLRDTWISVQRAETLLVHAATRQNPTALRDFSAQFDLDGKARALLSRMACGFDPQHLTAADYLVRYPFSSILTIQAGLDRLVEYNVTVAQGDGIYAVTELGERFVRSSQQIVSLMMESLDLGDIPPADVQKLLQYDRRILKSIAQASRPHGHPIFRHRRRGLHPPYDPPALWHHWQHVWTMLAASEDEEEYVRQLRGMDPLVWFVRRQIWFIHRRPWRARARTLDQLVRRATGYSPIEQAEEACRQAVQDLQTRGWIEAIEGEFWLTPEGLALCDEDEEEIDAGFLSCWPTFGEDEVEELQHIANRLNNRFEELPRPE